MATPTTLPASFTAGQVLTAAQMNDLRGAFRVLQVVSTTKTDRFTTTAAVGSPVVVTGLTATITPQSTTSKIFVMANVSCGMDFTQNQVFLFLYRDASPIVLGDASGSRTQITAMSSVGSSSVQETVNMSFLDSPASTSALTYQVYISKNVANGTAVVNGSFTNTDNSGFGVSTSTITVFEVSA